MRKLIIAVILFFILLFTLPLLMLKSCDDNKMGNDFENSIKSDSNLTVRVYRTDLNSVVQMDIEEYVLGVLAGEMPAAFHIEALKAQALAARSYTIKRMKRFGGSGCQAHAGADVCTDSVHCQAYVDIKKIGSDGIKKLRQAIEETKGEVIVYQDKLIDAVFHSTSGGSTANSEDVWQAKVPYLRGVVSEYESHSPKFTSTCDMTINEFVERVKRLDSKVQINIRNIKEEIKILERNEEDRIVRIKVGNKEFKGEKMRTALELNSTNFKYEIRSNRIYFTVTGYGHGIGLSQYGADGMGKKGYGYIDIIKHYYTDVEIINIYENENLSCQ